ncbi:MAG: polysaccharide biosynthesis protein [Comamonadaceae bacterium]|nr:polysaccharide biosynthesis protein [Comamonadaceae bacterium]
MVHAAALKHRARPPSTTRSSASRPTSSARMNLIDACIDTGVKRVVALSTDKARQPGQPVRRHQAGVGQAVRRRQLIRRRARHALRGRALRQRHGLARLGDPVLPVDPRQRACCRSPTSA